MFHCNYIFFFNFHQLNIYNEKILILYAHPEIEKLQVNKNFISDLQNMEGITFFDICEHSPEKIIDVKTQQALLKEHNVIVFHLSFFWYSIPAILKEWQDSVLEYSWIFGTDRNPLKDKLFFNTIIDEGSKDAYSAGASMTLPCVSCCFLLRKQQNCVKWFFYPHMWSTNHVLFLLLN